MDEALLMLKLMAAIQQAVPRLSRKHRKAMLELAVLDDWENNLHPLTNRQTEMLRSMPPLREAGVSATEAARDQFRHMLVIRRQAIKLACQRFAKQQSAGRERPPMGPRQHRQSLPRTLVKAGLSGN